MQIPARFRRTPDAVRQFGERLDRFAPYLLRSDVLADEATAAMAELGPPGACMKLLDRALREGIEAVPEAPAPLRALLEQVHRVPVWVDWGAIERGGSAFLRSGMLGGMVLGARALVLSYTAPGGNKPLVFSGRLQEQAGRRLAETGRFVQAVTRPGGLRRGADGFTMTVKVRMMHAGVRRVIRQSGRFRVDLWGEPINQHDMLGTLILFSVVVIDGLEQLGYRVSPQEAEDLVHLWRYVGHLIGVEADLLPGSYAEARRYGEMIRATQGTPDDDSRALVHALLESGVAGAKNDKVRRQAERQRAFAAGIIRYFLGDSLADELAVPRSPYRHIAPVLRAMVSATERTRKLPFVRDLALRAGDRYWDMAGNQVLRGISPDFMPPERVRSVMAA